MVRFTARRPSHVPCREREGGLRVLPGNPQDHPHYAEAQQGAQAACLSLCDARKRGCSLAWLPPAHIQRRGGIPLGPDHLDSRSILSRVELASAGRPPQAIPSCAQLCHAPFSVPRYKPSPTSAIPAEYTRDSITPIPLRRPPRTARCCSRTSTWGSTSERRLASSGLMALENPLS